MATPSLLLLLLVAATRRVRYVINRFIHSYSTHHFLYYDYGFQWAWENILHIL